MATTKPTAKPKTKPLLTQWLVSCWFEHFLFMYCMWVILFFLAPVFMRIGWIRIGLVMFFVNFILLLLLHGTLVFSLLCKDNVLFE